ncbi:MAG: hypothetical protein VKN33_00495, partial [Candidatus Sericytochromatia bacterium]|nr:hypothetical protein [Candidatus Sericytochromatia bacterium]
TAPAQPPTAVNPPATAPEQPPTAVNPPATAPAQPPTAVNPPTVRPGTPAEERARADLENFLARGENRQPDILSSALDRSPEVFRLSTPEQKARVMADLMQGFTSKEFRSSALRLLEMAEERGEVQDTLRAAAQLGQLDRILTDLGDHSAGVSMARILISANAYQASEVWKEMDDDATRALMRALGFQRPMISSSQTLRDLPEEARYHMIKQLTGGHMSVEEQAMARWINLHNEKKIEIREFQTGSELNGS